MLNKQTMFQQWAKRKARCQMADEKKKKKKKKKKEKKKLKILHNFYLQCINFLNLLYLESVS